MSSRKRRTSKKEEDRPERPKAQRSFWSGTITFGLVSIPVDFYPATRRYGSNLRMVTEEGQPVGKRYVCPVHDRPIVDEEIVRGFETESGEFVPITDEELESAAPEKTRDIELMRFVSRAELPVLLFSRAYILAPSGGSSKAYRLLVETMQQADHAGIASFVMRDKAYIVAILADDGVMRAETLRFSDEVRTPESIGLPKPPRVAKARTKEMLEAIESLTRAELDLSELRDRHGAELEKLVKDKLKRGRDVIEAKSDTSASGAYPDLPLESAIDLVALLKQRLEGSMQTPVQESTPSPSKKAPAKSATNLEKKSKTALYERAKTLGIDGRSAMTKKDLVRAIQKAAS